MTILSIVLLALTVLTIPLRAQHGSGEHGTATLFQQGHDVVVNISVAHVPPPEAPEFAHIHSGTCEHLGASTPYELQPVRYGRSRTVLKNVALSALTGGTYSIAIHRTLAHVSQHIACGGPISGAKTPTR